MRIYMKVKYKVMHIHNKIKSVNSEKKTKQAYTTETIDLRNLYKKLFMSFFGKVSKKIACRRFETQCRLKLKGHDFVSLFELSRWRHASRFLLSAIFRCNKTMNQLTSNNTYHVQLHRAIN